MRYEFEMVGYPIGYKRKAKDEPRRKLFTVQANTLLEAYQQAERHGIAECGDGKFKIWLQDNEDEIAKRSTRQM